RQVAECPREGVGAALDHVVLLELLRRQPEAALHGRRRASEHAALLGDACRAGALREERVDLLERRLQRTRDGRAAGGGDVVALEDAGDRVEATERIAHAAHRRIATVERARIVVGADGRDAPAAGTTDAAVERGAGIAVVAGGALGPGL